MGNEADNQQQPKAGSSGDGAKHLYRLCSECGERWDVTYLLPNRRYRCARCGATFRHDRDRATAAPDAIGKPRNPLGMIVTMPVAIVGLELAMAYFGGIDFERNREMLFMVAGASAPVSVMMFLFVRRSSRDADGVKAVTLMTSAVGILATMMFADSIPQNRYQPFMLVIIVWLVLGGMQFSRFMTNQWRLPAVGPNGKM